MRLTSPPSCAECHEIWEPKPPGNLWATSGLLRDPFTFHLFFNKPNYTQFDVFLTDRLFQITNLMHSSFIQQYVCYITILNMFRPVTCSSSGQIVLPQPLVSSPSVNSRTVCCLHSDDTRGCSNTICPPEDEQGAARNMLRIVM